MNKNHLFLASPQYWPIWFALGLLWLIVHLPFRWRINIGASFGKFIHLFPTKLKHITKTNIELCFPELTPAERATLVKKNFASLGIGLIEAGMGWWLPEDKLRALFKIKGLEHMEAALAKGKGVILLGPHFTSLELSGRLWSLHFSFATMYRPHKKPFIAFLHELFRKNSNIQYIPRNRVRDFLRVLNNNMSIWYAYDVDGGKTRSVFAPFFGIQTASLTAISRIVQTTGATVLPTRFHRIDDELGYECVLSAPIENFPSESLADDAAKLNEHLEKSIRLNPDQYVWQYKRFKTRPEGEKRFY